MKVAFVQDTFSRQLPAGFMPYDYIVTEAMDLAEENGQYDEYITMFPLLHQLMRKDASGALTNAEISVLITNIPLLSSDREIAVPTEKTNLNALLRTTAKDSGYTVIDV